MIEASEIKELIKQKKELEKNLKNNGMMKTVKSEKSNKIKPVKRVTYSPEEIERAKEIIRELGYAEYLESREKLIELLKKALNFEFTIPESEKLTTAIAILMGYDISGKDIIKHVAKQLAADLNDVIYIKVNTYTVLPTGEIIEKTLEDVIAEEALEEIEEGLEEIESIILSELRWKIRKIIREVLSDELRKIKEKKK